jgi:MFS family permease
VLLTNVAGLLVGFAMFSSFLLIPLFVQAPVRTGYGFGASVTEAGLYMAPSAAVMLFAGPLAGALGGRFGSRLTLIAGCAFAAASFAFLVVLHDAGWHIVVSSLLLGAGIAFAFSSMANLVVEAVPQRDVGVATGINTIMRTVGGGFGATLAVAIVTAETLPGTPLPVESGFTTTFLLSAGVALLALVAAVAIPARPAAD